jgi:hypothetical protein
VEKMIKNYLSESKARTSMVKKLAKKQITPEQVLEILVTKQKFPAKRAQEVLALMIEQSQEV